MYAEILASQVPEFIRDADVFSDVQLSEGNELDRIKYALDDLEKQLSPITATWALPFWEEAFGIPVNINDSYEYGLGFFTGYSYFKTFSINKNLTLDNFLINDDILVFPFIAYNKDIICDMKLKLIFTPMNISWILVLDLK